MRQRLDQIAFWDTGAPSYRWNELAVNEALKHNLGANYATRALALLHVALSDAMVATWDAKYAYQRPRPSDLDPLLTTVVAPPASPSYPSEHAAAAAAASAILAYVFPDDAQLFADKADEASRSRLMAGVQYPSDIAAGQELGRAVAALVIDRAQHDGSDAQWTGTVPTEPGHWNGTNPILPLAGTWKTWALASGSELRPGPPPAYDSPEEAAELAVLNNFQRTPKTNSDALFWEYGRAVRGTTGSGMNRRTRRSSSTAWTPIHHVLRGRTRSKASRSTTRAWPAWTPNTPIGRSDRSSSIQPSRRCSRRRTTRAIQRPMAASRAQRPAR